MPSLRMSLALKSWKTLYSLSVILSTQVLVPEIAMTSDEDSSSVVTTSRSDWPKLPYFHVTVQSYAPE